MKLRFSVRYAVLAVCLFAVEVLIAAFVHDRIIRPLFGDVLAVMLVIFSVAAILDLAPKKLAVAAWLFACAIEVSQYFQLGHYLGLESTIWMVILGATFDWLDILAYALGAWFGYLTLLWYKARA